MLNSLDPKERKKARDRAYYQTNRERIKERVNLKSLEYKALPIKAEGEKRCSICKTIKPFNDFHKSKRSKSGYKSQCKTCRISEPDLTKKREAQRRWQAANPERSLLNTARARAKRKGWEFTISLNDVVIPERCPVLGIKLFRGSVRANNSPTIDRIDNSKGYIKGNVIVVSWRANNLKSDATLEELKALATFYETKAQEISSASL